MFLDGIKKNAILRPDELAVSDLNSSLNYRELEEKSSLISQYIINVPTPNNTIGIIAARSVSSILAMVSVVKSGNRYVFIESIDDINKFIGADNLDLIINPDFNTKPIHNSVKIVSVEKMLKKQSLFDINLNCKSSHNSVYISFTSGTSGKSKGVIINNTALEHYTESIKSILKLNEGLTFGYMSALSADLGNTAIYLSFSTGGHLFIFDNESRRSPKLFWDCVQKYNVEFIKTTPSHFSALLAGLPNVFNKLKYLLLGGEKFDKALAVELIEKNVASNIYNHYGPTETTIGVSAHHVTLEDINHDDYDTIPIGRIWGEMKAHLHRKVDDIGELYLSGPQLSTGYLGNNDSITSPFVKIDNITHYKTGDLVREHADGVLEYKGRADRQLKIRGYRIEPDHIELIVKRELGIKNALVFSNLEGKREKLILAVTADENINELKVFQALKLHLPEHMLPDDIVALNEFPLEKNGKIDTKKIKYIYQKELKASEFIQQQDVTFGAGKNEIARKLWYKHFGSLNLEDNFFDMGKDSVDAIEFLANLQNEGLEITAKQFLDHPTLKGILYTLNSSTAKTLPFEYENTINRLHPIQWWYLENCKSFHGWFNQSFTLSTTNEISLTSFTEIIKNLLIAHPTLRTSFNFSEINTVTVLSQVDSFKESIAHYSLEGEVKENISKLNEISQRHNLEIDEASGKLAKFILVNTPLKSYVIFIIHHLSIDLVSWRILIDEFIRGYSKFQSRSKIKYHEINSYVQWTKELYNYANSVEYKKETQKLYQFYDAKSIDVGFEQGPKSKLGDYKSLWLAFPKNTVDELQIESSNYELSLPGFLLSKLVPWLYEVFNTNKIQIDIENHGREVLTDKLDISKTVGWFTSLFPIEFSSDLISKGEDDIISYMRQVEKYYPKKGLIYGIQKYINQNLSFSISPNICFNFLGKLDLDSDFKSQWAVENIDIGPCRNPNAKSQYSLIITAKIISDVLYVEFAYDPLLLNNEKLSSLAKIFKHTQSKVNRFTSRKDDVHIKHFDSHANGLVSYTPDMCIEASKLPQLNKKITNGEQVILLTGSTGFIGIHLLSEILTNTSWKVICLVRNDKSLIDLNSLARYYFNKDFTMHSKNGRLNILNGNLVEENLGMVNTVYQDLSESVEMIFNCAADVNLFSNIDARSSVNYSSVVGLCKFASFGRSKSLHHISTLAVSGYMDKDEEVSFSELDLDVGQSFNNSYEQSKYLAEKYLKNYQNSNGNVFIYRIGNITGHSDTGIFQKNAGSNRIYQMLKSYIETGCIPQSFEKLRLMQVDVVAKIILSISKDSRVPGGTFNIDEDYELDSIKLKKYFSNMDINLQIVEHSEYTRRLSELKGQDKLKVLTLFWIGRNRKNIALIKNKTDSIINDLGIKLNGITEEWFNKFISVNFGIKNKTKNKEVSYEY